MRVIERYATAAIADDLKDRGPFCDLHYLTAAGMVGISEYWATSLFRLKYSNDAKEYRICLLGLKDAARKLSGKCGWKITQAQIGTLSRDVIWYWIADTCPSCLGRGAQKISGTPMLEDAPCHPCGGTGRRALPQTGNMAEYAKALLCVLDRAESMAGGKLMHKIFDDITQNGL